MAPIATAASGGTTVIRLSSYGRPSPVFRKDRLVVRAGATFGTPLAATTGLCNSSARAAYFILLSAGITSDNT